MQSICVNTHWRTKYGIKDNLEWHIDRCIVDEIKQYHRCLAVVSYHYKKAYYKVHHNWMLRVYEWIDTLKNVAKLIYQLMRKWKTRHEMWNEWEKVTSRWMQSCVNFYMVIVTHPLDFAYLKCQYAKYRHKPNATGWENLETKMWAGHISFHEWSEAIPRKP